MNYEQIEYEIQHFSFSVEQISLEHRFMVKKVLDNLCGEFAESLIKKSSISADRAQVIRSNIKNVSANIYGSFEKVLKEFDHLFEKHFRIPENILLAENYGCGTQFTKTDEKLFEQKFEELIKTFKQNKFLLVSLGVELEMHKEIRPLLNRENDVGNKVEKALYEQSDVLECGEDVKVKILCEKFTQSMDKK